ncbi:MAG: hypothetical protein ACO1SV_20775 [Fimbriimonas sp.]
MLTPAVLALLMPLADPIVLARGQTVDMPGGPTSYQAVADTYIQSSLADGNQGGETILLGGPSRTILIRFGDLARVVPPTKRIRSASLVLTTTGGEAAELRSIGRVRAPWGEGPYLSLSATLRRNNAPVGTAKPVPPRGSATWRQRRAGEPGVGWQEAGAAVGRDVERIEGATLQAQEGDVTISGLAAAVQAMADRPLENHGFALSFAKSVEFASSQSNFGRPRLVLELEDAPASSGADLSVTLIGRTTASGAPPVDGDEVTYTAHVKNVGDAPSEGFASMWIVGEREGATAEGGKALAPGEETTVTLRRTHKPDKTDQRHQAIALRIMPKGRDASPRNDALEVQESAKWVELTMSRSTVDALMKERNALGSTAVEDWVQHQVSVLNEVYLDRSRFSFAPEGARVRVAVGKIDIIEGSSMAGKTDGTIQVLFAGGMPVGPSDRPFLMSLGSAIGIPPLTGSDVTLQENGIATRASADRFPGLLGYGDTRFEGSVPGLTILPYDPVSSPIFEVNPLEPTGLLSATEVATLNGRLDGTVEATGLPPLPKTLLVRVLDLQGRVLPNVELSFFQTNGGRLVEGAPAFNLVSGATGTALLPTRDGVGPFGKLEPNGSNHTMLVRATRNGVTEWSWLKAWQAMDTASRGTAAAAFLELRFNLPGAALEAGTNLAKERVVTDSAQSLPARLAAATDDDPKTEATLSGKVGDWVEIDLGRDRTIAEIDLLVRPGKFWSKFDILAYATGQTPNETVVWAKEVDFAWTADNRHDPVPNATGVVNVSYRGQPRRFRYIRLVNKGGGPGELGEVRAIPVVATGTP